MQGGAPRVVWLTLGTDPRAVSVTSAAQRLVAEGRPCHLVWDPVSGDIAQLLPIVRAGRALGTREHIEYLRDDFGHPLPGVNREGRLCVQIGVLGTPREPFTSCTMTGLGDILTWLDSWSIPRRWPAGQPASFRQADRPRSRALWAKGGHFGASQVPDCTSVGPGCIDIDQLTKAHSVTLTRPASARPGPARSRRSAAAAIALGQRGPRPARDLAPAVSAPAPAPKSTPSLTASGVLRVRLP
jgi:hypothetical protein